MDYRGEKMDAKEKVLVQVKQDGVRYINLQFIDITGNVKNVTIPSELLVDSLEKGTWFDGSSIEGFTRIHESDMYLKPDPETYAVIPWVTDEDKRTARIICDVYMPNGEPFEGDPRYILKKVLKEAEEMGYEFNTGPELEFFLFKKENGKIEPLPHDRGGYFDLSMDEAFLIRKEMTEALKKMGITVEASHHEVAHGQHEIDFKYGPALKTADNAVTFKYTLRAIATKHNLHATFMPKPISGIAGSGMHIHQSLFDNTGKNIFFDENDKYKFSELAYHFVGGQIKHAKGMSSILSPIVNSYKRLVPGYEAPVYICWAQVNRSALIRIPRYSEGRSRATRCEIRCPDPSSNPYLAFAVLLKAGLEGIRNKTEPPSPVEENLYHFDDNKLEELKIDILPTSLKEAVDELKKDTLIQDALGKHTYEAYLRTKKAEWDSYRLHVSDWEIKSYLEII